MTRPIPFLPAIVSGETLRIAPYHHSSTIDTHIKCKEVALDVLKRAPPTGTTRVSIVDGSRVKVVEVNTTAVKLYFQKLGFSPGEVEDALKADALGTLLIKRQIHSVLASLNVSLYDEDRRALINYLYECFSSPSKMDLFLSSRHPLEEPVGKFLFFSNRDGVKGFFVQHGDRIFDIVGGSLVETKKPLAPLADRIESAAERSLSAAPVREEAPSLAERVTTVETFKETSEKALEVIKKAAPSLTREEAAAITSFARTKLEELPKERAKSLYFQARETKLARSIEITPEGRVLIYLTKAKKKGDKILGEGFEGVVKVAVDLESGEKYAVKKVAKRSVNGMEMAKRFSKEEGFAQIETSFTVPGKAPKAASPAEEKEMYRMHFYDTDLYKLTYGRRVWWTAGKTPMDAATSRRLRREKAKPLFNTLIRSLAKMHREGLVHRDIKPANIFVKFDEKGIPSPYLGDMGFTCKEEEVPGIAGTLIYFSPSLIQTARKGPISADVARKADVWALGLTLAESLFPESFRQTRATMDYLRGVREDSRRECADELSRLKPSQLDARPRDRTPEYIVWRMLQIDPSQIPSLDELEKSLDALDWS